MLLLIIAGIVFYFQRTISWNNQKAEITSVQLPQSMINDLNELYSTSTDEFVLCLKGDIKDNVAVIDSYDYPDKFEANENDIYFSECDRFSFLSAFKKIKHLGTIHNHPNGVCHLGYMDCYTFGKTNDAITGIICGSDNIHFYTPISLIESINHEII